MTEGIARSEEIAGRSEGIAGREQRKEKKQWDDRQQRAKDRHKKKAGWKKAQRRKKWVWKKGHAPEQCEEARQRANHSRWEEGRKGEKKEGIQQGLRVID